MLLIGVYAAISKALGLRFRFPGRQDAYEVLGQVTDAGLLARLIADKEPVWQQITAEHDLNAMLFSDVGDWAFADWVFATNWDYVMSDVKRFNAGSTEVMDSEDMFLRQLAAFRADRIIP